MVKKIFDSKFWQKSFLIGFLVMAGFGLYFGYISAFDSANDCSYVGQTQCLGNGVQVCGYYDADPYLDWSSVANCLSQQTCSGGQCVANQPTGAVSVSLAPITLTPGTTYYNFLIRVLAGDTSTNSRVSKICVNSTDLNINQCNYCSNSNNCSYDFTISNVPTGTWRFYGIVFDNASQELARNSILTTFIPITPQAPVCSNDCSYSGQRSCLSNSSYKVCGNYDSDSCLDWSSANYCLSSQTCSSATGECLTSTPTCQSDCSYSGERKCSGSNGYQVCGQYNNDSCLEWSSVGYCSTNQTCNSGQCITLAPIVPVCSNECSYSGQKECSGTNGYRTCGNYDSDSCLEWTSMSFCLSNQTCVSGQCQNLPPVCQNDCSYSGQTQCSNNGTQICGQYDSDTCLEWSPSTDCGVSGWNGEYQCSNNILQRKWYDKGCQGSACFSNPLWKTVQDCGSDELTNNYQCSGNNVQRQKHKQGCQGSSCYSYYQWETIQTCSGNQTCQNNQCVDNTPVCQNECSSNGQRECSGNGYRTCGSYDSDTCLEWSPVNNCSTGQTCQSGQCINIAPVCSNDCSYSGQTQCSNNGTQICGQYDSDTCLEWSPPTDCGVSGWNGEYQCSNNILQRKWYDKGCSGNACFSNSLWKTVQDCGSDELTNNYQCSGNSVQRQKHKQGCQGTSCYSYYQWETIQTCSGNQTCQNNQCVDNTPVCSNDCSYSGQKECYGNGYRECGNYDSDSCLEWSYSNTCSGSTSCGYGSCSSNQKPSWYCSGGQCQYTCQTDSSCNSYNNDYLSCYDNDVWWFNYSGGRLNRNQDCGDSYCDNYGSLYCSGNNVYQKQTCYNRGCSNGTCFANNSQNDRLVQYCNSGQTCQNGSCQNINVCECSTGVCCDGCHYKNSSQICQTNSFQAEYSCPWGTGCGSNVGKRTTATFQYCSGAGSTCNGKILGSGVWSNWLVSVDCPINQGCSAGLSYCVAKTGCTVKPTPTPNPKPIIKEEVLECREESLSASLMIKPQDSDLWSEAVTLDKNKIGQLLLVVVNTGQKDLENILVIADIPKGVYYEDELTQDGQKVSGDIRSGIDIAKLKAGEMTAITFNISIDNNSVLDQGDDVVLEARAIVGEETAIDSVEIEAGKKGSGSGSGAGFLLWSGVKSMLKSWLFWLLLIVAGLLLFFAKRLGFDTWMEKRKLQKEMRNRVA